MVQDDKQAGDPGSLFAEWMKSAGDYWLSAAKAWSPVATEAAKSRATFPEGDLGKMQEAWQVLLNVWQTSSSALNFPQTMEAIIKGSTASPETAMKMLRTTWDGYSQLYQAWMKHCPKPQEPPKAESPEGFEAAMFKQWTAFYEKEVQPFLQAPQIGLTRLYQERANTALDKYLQLQTAVGEYIVHLGSPVAKSLTAIREKIEEQAKEGKLSGNFKDYYNMWIKSLEDEYSTLLKSPEYIASMGRALTAVEEYKIARDNVLVDVLQFLPIPTNKEMDELYRELHALKKTVNSLAQKVKKLESMK
jgi:class III poly(R)-hydroxyalkanoic acid synthase PhaE subunit